MPACPSRFCTFYVKYEDYIIRWDMMISLICCCKGTLEVQSFRQMLSGLSSERGKKEPIDYWSNTDGLVHRKKL